MYSGPIDTLVPSIFTYIAFVWNHHTTSPHVVTESDIYRIQYRQVNPMQLQVHYTSADNMIIVYEECYKTRDTLTLPTSCSLVLLYLLAATSTPFERFVDERYRTRLAFLVALTNWLPQSGVTSLRCDGPPAGINKNCLYMYCTPGYEHFTPIKLVAYRIASGRRLTAMYYYITQHNSKTPKYPTHKHTYRSCHVCPSTLHVYPPRNHPTSIPATL